MFLRCFRGIDPQTRPSGDDGALIVTSWHLGRGGVDLVVDAASEERVAVGGEFGAEELEEVGEEEGFFAGRHCEDQGGGKGDKETVTQICL